jgi:lipopolysaccharide transport system permease protein
VIEAAGRGEQGSVQRLLSYRGLFYCLVARNLKIRFGGIRRMSWLGLLLTQINPIVIIAVYAWVGGQILRVQQPNYLIFLAVGHIHWTLFTTVISQACGSVYRDAAMMRVVPFPYILLCLADVVDQLSEVLVTLVLLLLLFPLLGGEYHLTMLLYPLLFALQVVFMSGLAAAFAVAQAYYHDIGQLQALAIRLLFWFTPVIYSTSMVPDGFRGLLRTLNPMALFLDMYRDVLCYYQFPPLRDWMLLSLHVALAAGFGFWLFHRLERYLPEKF